MPKEEWAKNTIPSLFRMHSLWPWGDQCKKCYGHGFESDNEECLSCGGRGRTGGWEGVTEGSPLSVLDVGCGLSLKSKYISTFVRVGLDIHRPYLEAVESEVPWIPVCADATRLSDLFLPNTFDLVLLLDLVEHMERDTAVKLMRSAEEIASVAVIVETPNGYLPQDLDILGFGQHSLQTHRCGFEESELRDMGYRTFVRSYSLAPIKRHTTEPLVTECELLEGIKDVRS